MTTPNSIPNQPAARRSTLWQRLGSMRWFDGAPPTRGAPERLSRALFDLTKALPKDLIPEHIQIAPSEQELEDAGRLLLRKELPPWRSALRTVLEQKLPCLLDVEHRSEGLAFVRSGDAWFLHKRSIPVPEERLHAQLQMAAHKSWSSDSIRALTTRILWDLGAFVTFELANTPRSQNPFFPLLRIYEEGLVLLDLTAARALIWRP